ncbi:MAG: decaprenyl-phosphate phosphoribosyltransferase [Planctomycetes bacterium]|nr:decaprenyl-phosphate phosphoribosyltransferase [Planctomycetota bacterium]
MRLPALLRALRPHQWVKNIFVLAAVAFSRADQTALHPTDWHDVRQALFAFAAFCLGASAIYLVNDVLDVESDRAHPEKKNRPIAAGEVGVPTALAASLVCVVGALAFGWFAGGGGYDVLIVVALYVAMNFAYSTKLKHVVLIDAFCIATGFLLRVEGGARAADATVSHWLMLCTLFIALFLALCKRRAEIDLLGENRGEHRANLREYTVGFLDQMVTVLAATTIVCYTMYTVSDDTAAKFGKDNHLLYSVPLVVFGLARYMLLVQTRRGGGSPTKVLLGGDVLFVLNALAWVGVVGFSIYFRG